jgi:hypothetical protein
MKSTGEGTSENKPTVIGADPDFKTPGDEIVCPGCGINFKFPNPRLAVICPACSLSGFQFPENVSTCPGCATKGECIIVDGIHYKVWHPLPPEVQTKFDAQKSVEDIVATWQRVLGIKLDPEKVAKHKAVWEGYNRRKPEATRYMTQEELEALRKEIVDSLPAYDTTRERAEFLATHLTHPNAPGAPAVPMQEKSNKPYLGKNGELVIPLDCPDKYKWWQGGQTIAETLAELTTARICKRSVLS